MNALLISTKSLINQNLQETINESVAKWKIPTMESEAVQPVNTETTVKEIKTPLYTTQKTKLKANWGLALNSMHHMSGIIFLEGR